MSRFFQSEPASFTRILNTIAPGESQRFEFRQFVSFRPLNVGFSNFGQGATLLFENGIAHEGYSASADFFSFFNGSATRADFDGRFLAGAPGSIAIIGLLRSALWERRP
jgi:hypothetical protein